MNEEELKQYILRRLRRAFLQVELTEDDLDDALDQARRWFAAKKGVKKNVLADFFSGTTQYALDDITNDIDTVLDVSFPVPAMDISLIFSPYILQDEKVPYDVFAAPSSMGLYSSYTQTIQYVATAKRILNAEADWRQEGRDLIIFPIPKNNGQMRIEYKSHNFTIEQLSERDHDLVKRYALAFAKRDVAETRSKYAGFPGAQGETTLNGAAMKQEVQAELETLEKEIAQSAYPMGYLVG